MIDMTINKTINKTINVDTTSKDDDLNCNLSRVTAFVFLVAFVFRVRRSPGSHKIRVAVVLSCCRKQTVNTKYSDQTELPITDKRLYGRL